MMSIRHSMAGPVRVGHGSMVTPRGRALSGIDLETALVRIGAVPPGYLPLDRRERQ